MAAVYAGSVAAQKAGTYRKRHAAGRVLGDSVVYEAAGAMADNTVILLGEVPVDAPILDIIFASDDLGTTGLVNVGLYPGNIDPALITDASAVDEDCFATLIDVNTAAVAPVSVRYEAANIDTTGKLAWEIAGLSAKPDYPTFFLALTLAAATTAGGTLATRWSYTVA